MTHSDQTIIRRLTGARVRIGRAELTLGPVYRLSAYDAVAQSFNVLSERLLVPHVVSAADVLSAKRSGILHIIR